MTFIIEGQTYTYILFETNFYYNFPYIIRYLSPLFIQTFYLKEVKTKKGITGEQLIGISCDSASVFFLILGIIIIARKRYENQFEYDCVDDNDDSSFDNVNLQIIPIINDNNNENIKKVEETQFWF